MAYWLEKRTVQIRGSSSQIIWERYAVCGSSGLLERVRMGQKHPEHWRVISESVCASSLLSSMKKAG